MVFLSSVLNMVRKEFLQLRRDRRMLGISIVAPLVQLIIFGYAANLDLKHLPMAVFNQDHSQLSREFVDKFASSGYFDIKYQMENLRQIEQAVDAGMAKVALIIPLDFEKRLRRGETAILSLILDGSDGNVAGISLNYATIIVERFSQNWLMKSLNENLIRIAGTNLGPILSSKGQLVDDRIRVWYNPALESRYYMLPGVIAMILLLVTTLLTAVSIAKEKELGTMEQLIVTPLGRAEILVGKLIPYIIIGFADMTLVILVGVYWFHLEVKGSILLLFLLSILFLMNTLALGLLISVVSQTQQQAMMTTFFVILPSILLSGFIFPIENMPPAVRYLTYAIPFRYFLTIVRGIFLKGVGMGVLWDESLILFLFGLSLLMVSILTFRKHL
ncbi:ABC transporter [bacterium (candidate division B38) B3_B38]|nr:MAG: ABC transporter [bacterium (candidate division B38) B3_B38]